MAAGVEPGWHRALGHHQPWFSMGGGHVGDNIHQSGPSHGGQRQCTFVANNNSPPHAYVPLHQPNIYGIPFTPYAYMPNRPPMAGMPHYENTPGYGQNQASFFQVTEAYQHGVLVNGYTFPSQMAQGATNPNYMHSWDVPMGGYQNQLFMPNPNPMYA